MCTVVPTPDGKGKAEDVTNPDGSPLQAEPFGRGGAQAGFGSDELPNEILHLMYDREQARKNRDWDKSDRLREVQPHPMPCRIPRDKASHATWHYATRYPMRLWIPRDTASHATWHPT